MGAVLQVEGLRIAFGETVAVDGVDLMVAEGEIVAVLGPSGCGKTTLLRAIAGLQDPDAGRIALGGRELAGVPPHRRGVGLMFQDHALFPHRDVTGNVAFGLRMARTPRPVLTERVTEVLDLVGLAGFEHRAIGSLSGGEQQRVALARALAPQPRLLLLDEPLGSLDRALRDRLVVELAILFRRLGLTAVFVTHDQGEAFSVADRVVLMRGGQVVQQGRPAEVWSRPADEATARFLGFTNLIPATVADGVAHSPLGDFEAPGVAHGPGVAVLRSDAVALVADGLPGVVQRVTFAGDHFLVTVITDAGPVLDAAVTGAVPAPGDGVAVAVRATGVVVVPR
ncbi:MAG: ABC transporter ATP-binding protein [Acidimicrobiales bacterium]